MFNKVILVGSLTRDVEMRYTSSGSAIGKVGIATNRKFKSASGELRDETMFIDLTFFGRTAEIAKQYLTRGSKVLIEGRIVLEKWQAQDGTNRSKHSITVESLQMLDSRGGGRVKQQSPQNGYSAPQQQQNNIPQEPDTPKINVNNEEIPF